MTHLCTSTTVAAAFAAGAGGAINGGSKFVFVSVTGAEDALGVESGKFVSRAADLSGSGWPAATAVVKSAARAALSSTRSFKVA
ncbi:hypothetical protein FQZ97_1074890 [compost metagenome]